MPRWCLLMYTILNFFEVQLVCFFFYHRVSYYFLNVIYEHFPTLLSLLSRNTTLMSASYSGCDSASPLGSHLTISSIVPFAIYINLWSHLWPLALLSEKCSCLVKRQTFVWTLGFCVCFTCFLPRLEDFHWSNDGSTKPSVFFHRESGFLAGWP